MRLTWFLFTVSAGTFLSLVGAQNIRGQIFDFGSVDSTTGTQPGESPFVVGGLPNDGNYLGFFGGLPNDENDADAPTDNPPGVPLTYSSSSSDRRPLTMETTRMLLQTVLPGVSLTFSSSSSDRRPLTMETTWMLLRTPLTMEMTAEETTAEEMTAEVRH
jgi:hypothetical protein